MELRHLRYFVTVASELHFGRAAERLFISQPSLSEQIRGLEGELGLKLLERNRRGVRLTPEGTAFLPQAQAVVRQADQIALIDKPLLMIAGSKADTRYMSEDALPKATGTNDKELFLIEGARHIETYWVDRYVDAALDKLTDFYSKNL